MNARVTLSDGRLTPTGTSYFQLLALVEQELPLRTPASPMPGSCTVPLSDAVPTTPGPLPPTDDTDSEPSALDEAEGASEEEPPEGLAATEMPAGAAAGGAPAHGKDLLTSPATRTMHRKLSGAACGLCCKPELTLLPERCSISRT